MEQVDKEYLFSEIELATDILGPDGNPFTLPSSFGISYMFKVLSFKPIETIRRVLQTEGEDSEEEFIPLPILTTKYDDITSRMISHFIINENLRHHSEFDLEISSNGLQHVIDANMDSFILSNTPMSLKVKNPNVVALPNPYGVSEDVAQAQAIAGATTSSVEGVTTLNMLSGSGGGPLLRATQILKVYNRLKYIGVQYGDKLDNYLYLIGQIFPDSEDDLEEVEKLKIMENGTQGKITKYRVIGSIFKPFGFKLWLYFASFFL
jgi:hypothetical protein